MRARFPLIIAGAAVLLLGACTRAPMHRAVWRDAWVWSQPADSLSLAAFRALPAADRAARREDAARLAGAAEGAEHHADAVALLTTAAGLDPADPGLWLRLAAECRRVGDLDRALACLDAAAAAGQGPGRGRRHATALDVALARGWIHRGRGEWTEALAWSDSARAISPQDRRVQILHGLALAARGDAQGAFNLSRHIEVTDFFRFEWRWIRGMAEFAQGGLADAYHWLRGVRPDQPWSADYWSDYGMVCERLGDEPEARRAYRNAAVALGLPSGTTGTLRVRVPTPGADRPLTLDLVMAYDGWPVAGSRLGWALTAADSALAANTPRRRLHWSDRASGLLSTCISWDLEPRRCRELRGLVYAAMGAEALARRDFRRAVREADGLDTVDPRVLLAYGHDLLDGDHWRRAAPLLRAGLERRPEDARGWADLGLARLMLGQESAGDEALGHALRLDPELAAAWYNRGLARFRGGRWGEAADDLARAAELAPAQRGRSQPPAPGPAAGPAAGALRGRSRT